MISMLDIDPAVEVGRDQNGAILYDGDRVLSYNLWAEGEVWPLGAPKRGVPAVIRRGEEPGQLYVVAADGSGYTGCRPEMPRYGVIKEPGRAHA